MVRGNDLEQRATRQNQRNRQIKGSLACSRNMGGTGGSEEIPPPCFLSCEGMLVGERFLICKILLIQPYSKELAHAVVFSAWSNP